MYAKVLDNLLNIFGELTKTFKEYEKYVYPKVYYTRCVLISCYILFSIAFILSFIIFSWRKYITNYFTYLCTLIPMCIFFFILVLVIYWAYTKNLKKLIEEQNTSKFKFRRDELIKYFKQNYGGNAYNFVTLIIDDSIKSENQKDSQTKERIEFIMEIPMLLITSFIGYSIGVIADKGFNNPLTIITIILLLLLVLKGTIKFTHSFIKDDFPLFKGEKKRLLLSALQDIKYKLLEVDG